MPSFSALEIAEYQRRWDHLDVQMRLELLSASPETRLRQLAAMMQSRDLFRSDPERDRDKQRVIARWQALRAAYVR